MLLLLLKPDSLAYQVAHSAPHFRPNLDFPPHPTFDKSPYPGTADVGPLVPVQCVQESGPKDSLMPLSAGFLKTKKVERTKGRAVSDINKQDMRWSSALSRSRGNMFPPRRKASRVMRILPAYLLISRIGLHRVENPAN